MQRVRNCRTRAERSVAIVQKSMPHYRVPLFIMLRDKLAADGIELRVLSGEGNDLERSRADLARLGWEVPLRRHDVGLGPWRLEWHSILRETRSDDLIIVEDAARIASNHLAILRRRSIGSPKVALWGHGFDRQNATVPGKSQLRRWSQHRADWYFAYTESARLHLESTGVDPGNVTVLQNTIDTAELRDHLDRVTDKDRSAFATEHGLKLQGPTAVYCGGLYEEKRLDLLIAAGAMIQARIADFHLLIIGAGPQQDLVEGAARSAPWLSYLGPLFGAEKAIALDASNVMVIPGLVGLAIVDSFTAGLPLITRAINGHGPEIDYLAPGQNGLLLPGSATAADLAESVAELISSQPRLSELSSGARSSARGLTLPHMADNFSAGIRQVLRSLR